MPPARTGRPIATYDVTPIGKGMANFGQAIAQAGANLAAHQDASDKYDAEAKFQEFKWNQMQALDQAKNDTTPDQVNGFSDRWVKGYQENANQFMESIPDRLKRDYAFKLKSTERQGFGEASRFMRGEQKRQAINRLSDAKTSYIQRGQSGAPLEDIANDYATLVKTNPYLSEIEKDTVVRRDLGDIEIAHAQARWKSSTDPDAVMRDLGGVLLDTEENPELRANPIYRNKPYEQLPEPKGAIEPGNIVLDNRKVVKAKDGQIMTERSFSIGTDQGEVLLPSIIDGKEVSQEQAVEHFRKTGEHLGVFKSSKDATAYAKALHERQGRVYGGQANDNRANPERISIRLETGKNDPLKGVSQVARDSGGTKSYGNFGLNSGGSAQQFVAKYGENFDLTAEPGTPEFDEQWKNAAGAAPVELHAAEMEWYQDNVVAGISDKLAKDGVSKDIADDPRVQAYFADRIVQQGPASIDGMNKHKQRIASAFADSDGDVAKFLKNITEADRASLQSDFPTALRTGAYSERGHDTRLNGRLKMALGTTGEVAPTRPNVLSASYKGPYKNIPADARMKLMQAFQSEYNQKKRAISILKGETPVDPGGKKDRETIDNASEVMLPTERIQSRDPQVADDLSRLAEKISYVPKSAFNALRGMAINGTSEDRAYAYQIFGRLMRERPGALKAGGGDGFNKELVDEAETFNTMVGDVGIPPDQAIGRIDEMRTADFKAMRDSRKKEADAVVKDLTVDDITKEYGGWFKSRPAAGGSDRRASFMLDAYRDDVRYHYTRTGDAELAKQIALNEMTKTYKVSTITGNKRLMRNRPEDYYPPIQTAPGEDPSYEYFQNELKHSVNEAAGRLRRVDTDANPELRASIGKKEGFVELGDQIPMEDIFIEANDRTMADIASGSVYPSYGVVWRQKDENGIPAFMTAPTPFYVDVKDVKSKQLEMQHSEFKRRSARAKRLDALNDTVLNKLQEIRQYNRENINSIFGTNESGGEATSGEPPVNATLPAFVTAPEPFSAATDKEAAQARQEELRRLEFLPFFEDQIGQ